MLTLTTDTSACTKELVEIVTCGSQSANLILGQPSCSKTVTVSEEP